MKILKIDSVPQLQGLTTNKGLLWMMLGGFAFATMGAMTHQLGKNCDWLVIAFFRMFLTFIITAGLALRSGINPFLLTRPLLWIRSFIGSTAMLSTFYALTILPISDVAVLTETRPIWVALIAGYLLGESASRKVWISIVLGIVGVILVEHPMIVRQEFAGLVALYAAMAGAVVMICLRKLRDLDPRVIVTHFSGTASIIALLVIIFHREGFHFSAFSSSYSMILLLAVGVFGTIGQLAMTKAFSMDEAPTVASAGYVRVGFSAGYDLLIWNYVIEGPTIIGMLLILTSTAWLFTMGRGRKITENTET